MRSKWRMLKSDAVIGYNIFNNMNDLWNNSEWGHFIRRHAYVMSIGIIKGIGQRPELLTVFK